MYQITGIDTTGSEESLIAKAISLGLIPAGEYYAEIKTISKEGEAQLTPLVVPSKANRIIKNAIVPTTTTPSPAAKESSPIVPVEVSTEAK